MDFSKILDSLDPRLLEELLSLKSQDDDSEHNHSFQDTDWIDREANYVDEKILKVGNRDVESNEINQDAFNPEFWWLQNTTVFQEHFSALSTPESRVEFVRKYFSGVGIKQEVLEKYQKNSETSRQLLNRGTELYKLKNFLGALHYYNLALLFAETDTQAVGFSCANRSAVLVELGHFEEALQDVELALKNKYPASQIEKLEKRKSRCQKSMQKKQAEYLAVNPKVREEVESEMQQVKNIRDELLVLKRPNSLIPAAAEFVEIKFDTGQGRYLAVNQDVAPGTVLIVEEPYVNTLHGQSKWDTEHCHHCFKSIRRGIPCESCVFPIYCGESCRINAKKIHQYECSCLPSLHALYSVIQVLQALRLIFRAGPTELFRLFETRDPAYFSQTQPFGTEPNCVYDSRSYLPMFHLETNSDKLLFEKRLSNVRLALIATTVVDTGTKFFEDIPADRKSEFKEFLTTVMLRHIEANRVNATGLGDTPGLDNVSFADSYTGKFSSKELPSFLNTVDFRKFADAIYPVFSLINHSCAPNVLYLNDIANGTMIVIAHRALKKGEPLYISYADRYSITGINDRQSDLQNRYYFKCGCTACKLNWPTSQELMIRQPTFCCPTCSKSFPEHDTGSSRFRKCRLTAPAWKCGLCGKRYKERELSMLLKLNMGLVAEVYQLLRLNRPRKAFDLFMKVCEYFQFNICPPSAHLCSLQDLFKKTVALILHFAK